MSTETDALIELLVQLKKIVGTVPDQAKMLLTSQPSLAYSLIQLMIKMNILSAEVLQKTLSSMANSHPQPLPPAQHAPLPGPSHAPPVMPNGHSQAVPGFQHYPQPSHPYNGQAHPPQTHSTAPPYSNPIPPTPTPPQLPPNAQAMLTAIPDDQKNMILQILSYTPEQIGQLAPADRATFVQLRATFGIGS
ncbi:hypothetical protein JB92DRAFT_3015857 [Gautieria morchelliformis]|nr:hypothetical protein JB92DRAFT_3015857 [Gautieria morchelliformis]